MPQLPDRQARSPMGTKLRSQLGAYAKSCGPQNPCEPCPNGIPILAKVIVSGITDLNIPFICPSPEGGWGFFNDTWYFTFGRQGIGPYLFTCPGTNNLGVRNELMGPSVFHTMERLASGAFGEIYLIWPPWSIFGFQAYSNRMQLLFHLTTDLTSQWLLYTGPVDVVLCSGSMTLDFTTTLGSGCLGTYPSSLTVSIEKIAPCPSPECELDTTVDKNTFIFQYPAEPLVNCSGLSTGPTGNSVISILTRTGNCIWEAWWSSMPYNPVIAPQFFVMNFYFKLEYLGSGDLKLWLYTGLDSSGHLDGIYEGNFSIADINDQCIPKNLLPTFQDCAPQGPPHPTRFTIW